MIERVRLMLKGLLEPGDVKRHVLTQTPHQVPDVLRFRPFFYYFSGFVFFLLPFASLFERFQLPDDDATGIRLLSSFFCFAEECPWKSEI